MGINSYNSYWFIIFLFKIFFSVYSLEGNDRIDPSTIVLLNITDGKPNDRRIYWTSPYNPNGLILNYRVKLLRNDESVIILFMKIKFKYFFRHQ